MLNIFISAPRSGSTRLGQIFKTQMVKFIDEAFHPHCMGWGFLSDEYRSECSNILNCREEEVNIDLLRQSINVLSLTDAYYKKKMPYMIEIFPKHIDGATIKELCRLYPVTILQRNLIDAFISAQKAQIVQKYEKVQTKDLKVDLDADVFKNFCINRISFYKKIKKNTLSEGGTITVINYEDWCNYPNNMQSFVLIQLLNLQGFNFACPSNEGKKLVEGLPLLASKEIKDFSILERQDVSDKWQEKIRNIEDFTQKCVDNNSFKFISRRPLQNN